MSTIVKRELPILLGGFVGFVLIGAYFLEVPEISSLASTLTLYGTIIATMALFMSAFTTSLVQIRYIIKREKEWYFNLLLMVVLFVFLIIGVSTGSASPQYRYLYKRILTPIGTYSWALNGMAMMLTAIRVFRVRTFEASLLFAAAMFVMFQAVPIGPAIWPGFQPIGEWLLNVPLPAGNRGFVITAGIGGILLSIRTLLGKERRQLSIEAETE